MNSAARAEIPADKLRDGDIIFQISKSSQSKAIQLATHSKYTHMGVVFRTQNEWNVYEAVGPVKSTPLRSWILRGKGSHYFVKRVKNSCMLEPGALSRLITSSRKYIRKPYDPYFEWSDDRIYCSELVWKMYKQAFKIEIGKLQTLKEFDLSSEIVKGKLVERYGNNVPLNEQVITPSAIFESPELITVCSR